MFETLYIKIACHLLKRFGLSVAVRRRNLQGQFLEPLARPSASGLPVKIPSHRAVAHMFAVNLTEILDSCSLVLPKHFSL